MKVDTTTTLSVIQNSDGDVITIAIYNHTSALPDTSLPELARLEIKEHMMNENSTEEIAKDPSSQSESDDGLAPTTTSTTDDQDPDSTIPVLEEPMHAIDACYGDTKIISKEAQGKDQTSKECSDKGRAVTLLPMLHSHPGAISNPVVQLQSSSADTELAGTQSPSLDSIRVSDALAENSTVGNSGSSAHLDHLARAQIEQEQRDAYMRVVNRNFANLIYYMYFSSTTKEFCSDKLSDTESESRFELVDAVTLEYYKISDPSSYQSFLVNLLSGVRHSGIPAEQFGADLKIRLKNYSSALKTFWTNKNDDTEVNIIAPTMFREEDIDVLQKHSRYHGLLPPSRPGPSKRGFLGCQSTETSTSTGVGDYLLSSIQFASEEKQQHSGTKRTRSCVFKSMMSTTEIGGTRNHEMPANEDLSRKQLLTCDNPLNERDVLLGRGGGTNNHKGNVLYLLEKLKLQQRYSLIATQKEKKSIARELVQIVHERLGGRFVARDSSSGRWYEVDDEVARRKASQTLREDKTSTEQQLKRKSLVRKLYEIDHPTSAI